MSHNSGGKKETGNHNYWLAHGFGRTLGPTSWGDLNDIMIGILNLSAFWLNKVKEETEKGEWAATSGKQCYNL